MRHGSLILFLVLAGCPSGGGGIGERCTDRGDCAGSLQCVAQACMPRCQRAPECGDGYACDADGLCQPATGQAGDACTSEVDCAPGLSCQLEGTDLDPAGHLHASCVAEVAGRPAGAACTTDAQCHNSTCALGHCLDLCAGTRDCGAGTSCAQVPRIEAAGAMFGACLQAHGTLRWALPIHGPADDDVRLPVPDSARAVAVTFAVEDPSQKVGATEIIAPSGTQVFDLGLDYFHTPVRHLPEFSQSVLAMPSSPTTPLEAGMYRLHVSSLRPPFQKGFAGSATPTAIATIKLDASVILDLHFYFLDFADHPCAAAFGGTLDAGIARSASFFQNDFLGMLRGVFAHGGVALGTLTYEDLRDHPELDALEISSAPALLALGAHDVGINVFFVRSLSPAGLQAFGPGPGPAGIPGTMQSGIVVGLDTLCYRSWAQVARLTSHELARYMGLYDNLEADLVHTDPIDDSDPSSANLMFYSERGGVELSAGQREILARSPVLR